MDRTIVLAASAPVPVGHLVEVAERAAGDDAAPVREVVALTDRETGVRYLGSEASGGELIRWQGRVLATTLSSDAGGPRTTVRIEVVSTPALEAELALREADAAAEAAKTEADRWGGADKPPYREPTHRIW